MYFSPAPKILGSTLRRTVIVRLVCVCALCMNSSDSPIQFVIIIKHGLTETAIVTPTFRTPTTECDLFKRRVEKWRKIFTEHQNEIYNPWSPANISQSDRKGPD
jgi:hypothetical protein